MKKFIEWLEVKNARLRRLMLLVALFSNIFVTFLLLIVMCFGVDIRPFLGFYTAFIGLGMSAIGFYTATKPREDKQFNNVKNNELVEKF